MPILLAPTGHEKGWEVCAPTWDCSVIDLVIGSSDRSPKAQYDLQFAKGTQLPCDKDRVASNGGVNTSIGVSPLMRLGIREKTSEPADDRLCGTSFADATGTVAPHARLASDERIGNSVRVRRDAADGQK